MKLGPRTARLLREAIVLAHVEGARWAGYHGDGEGYPRDSEVVRTVLISATRLGDTFPTLARLDAAQEADAAYRREFAEALMAEIAAIQQTPGDPR